MNILEKHTTCKLVLISLVCALFIIYPNIAWLPWELSFMKEGAQIKHLLFFAFRYLFFCMLIFLLIKVNLQKFSTLSFGKRVWYNFLICTLAYAVFFGGTVWVYHKVSHLGSIVLFQFFVVCFLCTFIGHTYLLYITQLKKEQEIELLKIENLQSRYDSLKNQINPHFFFNSLNGLTALIRKKNDENTLTYVNKMSDVFRYILQSDKKTLVTLAEELEFVHAFFYMMEVRFANKLTFHIDVNREMRFQKLPVLSILPLIENVVMHNQIDSEHKMVVSIYLNDQNELVVSNRIYPKLVPADTNGTGLKNLNNRFLLLMNHPVRTAIDNDMFYAYLPLNQIR